MMGHEGSSARFLWGGRREGRTGGGVGGNVAVVVVEV